jgi:hypothetical protein
VSERETAIQENLKMKVEQLMTRDVKVCSDSDTSRRGTDVGI